MDASRWYLRTQDETFGPETRARLVEWARLGRIQPGQELSEDGETWVSVEDVPFLDMRFSIDLGDGNPRGPFNREAAEALLKSGRLPPGATLVETREPFPSEPPQPETPAEASVAPVAEAVPEPHVADVGQTPEPEVRIVEKFVEKIVEVPVEKIVEKEVRVEVPVEKIVEKVVVDETRVKDLEGLLGSAEAKAGKLQEQVHALEDELRRLPQAASEVADVQAAVYGIMTGEADEIGNMVESEKRAFEEFKARHLARTEALLERRRSLLKRAGVNIEDMTRRALRERPEDPRTAQLRKELDDVRQAHDREAAEHAAQVRKLSERLREAEAEQLRLSAGEKDLTQLRAEVESLRERLQVREKELVAERQMAEELRRQQATRQQALMNRLASLESPSIGTAQSLETNQSREARLVKLPGWMKLRK